MCGLHGRFLFALSTSLVPRLLPRSSVVGASGCSLPSSRFFAWHLGVRSSTRHGCHALSRMGIAEQAPLCIASPVSQRIIFVFDSSPSRRGRSDPFGFAFASLPRALTSSLRPSSSSPHGWFPHSHVWSSWPLPLRFVDHAGSDILAALFRRWCCRSLALALRFFALHSDVCSSTRYGCQARSRMGAPD